MKSLWRAGPIAGFLVMWVVSGSLNAATIVVPNAYTNAEAPSNVAAFFEYTNTIEYLWAASQLAGVPAGSTITAIGFRLDGGSVSGPSSPVANPAFTLQLSTSLVPIGSLSTVFSNNEGADITTVFSGALNIPANSYAGGAGANPFFFLQFTTPYTYMGGDLLVTSAISGTPASVLFDAVHEGVLVDTAAEFATAHVANAPVTAFQYAPASSVPEPGTMALWGTGMLLCVLKKRLRKLT